MTFSALYNYFDYFYPPTPSDPPSFFHTYLYMYVCMCGESWLHLMHRALFASGNPCEGKIRGYGTRAARPACTAVWLPFKQKPEQTGLPNCNNLSTQVHSL